MKFHIFILVYILGDSLRMFASQHNFYKKFANKMIALDARSQMDFQANFFANFGFLLTMRTRHEYLH